MEREPHTLEAVTFTGYSGSPVTAASRCSCGRVFAETDITSDSARDKLTRSHEDHRQAFSGGQLGHAPESVGSEVDRIARAESEYYESPSLADSADILAIRDGLRLSLLAVSRAMNRERDHEDSGEPTEGWKDLQVVQSLTRRALRATHELGPRP